jgi:hypothetical protein
VAFSSRYSRRQRQSGWSDVGASEVFADEEERLPGYPCGGVAHAVAEVEAGRMMTLAKANEGFLGGIPVTIVEGDGYYLVFAKKGRESSVARDSEPAH